MPSKAKDSTSPQGLAYAFAVALCLLAPLVVFLTANNYAVFAAEVLPLHLAALVVGLVIGALVKFRLTFLARLALWACVVVAIAFLYDLKSLPWVIAVTVTSGVTIWMLRDNAAVVMLVAAAMLVFSTLGLHYFGRSTTAPQHPEGQDSAVDARTDLPPVVHLVLDEFAGLRGFPGELPGSHELVSKLIDYYLTQGFDLYSHAYSQYYQSIDSLPNLVNFTSDDTKQAFLTGTSAPYLVSTNKYFEHLLGLGYMLHVYQSSYLNFCETPRVTVRSCSTYQSNSIATIADVDIPTGQKSWFILNSFLDSSAFLRKVRRKYLLAGERLNIALPAWPSGNSRTGPLAVMPTIAALKAVLRELSPGEVHFAHLMLPHYPYILDADCALKPLVHTWLNIAPFEVEGQLLGEQNNTASRAERYGQYLAQVECTQAVIEELFAAIRASGQWQRSIIIIHGDHGSRIVRRIPLVSNLDVLVEDDFRDTYSAFFAVKSGTSTGRLDASPWPLQTLLAGAWQLSAPKLESQQVYLLAPDQADLIATPLLGFGTIPSIRNHR